MAKIAEIRDRLIAQRVVPVLRLPNAELTQRAVECLAEAGFAIFEITMTTPGAVALLQRLSNKGLVCGAGTVLDLDTAARCLDAGARFVVSPAFIPQLTRVTHDGGAAALIGGFTPGEILAAHREGADIVKVFPASTGGPAHLRGMRAVFPDIPMCPTGGVSLANYKDYLAAGAVFVGVGNDIVDQKALASGDRAAVVAHARKFLQ